MESTNCDLGSGMLKLPGRLDELLQRYSHLLPKGAEDELPLLKGDLEEIIALLQKSGEGHHASMVKCWTKEVRELSDDMEDFLDHYEYAASGFLQDGIITRRKIPRHHKIIRWRRNKTPCIPKKLKQRLWMANKIREFSERAQEALERHSKYNLLDTNTASSRSPSASSGAQHPTPAVDDLHNNSDIEFTIIDDLEELFMTTHGTGVNNLKVLSIFGFGGVGKTKLAKELYNRLGPQFECRAFVQVSQKSDMRGIFGSMLSQVCPHHHLDNWKVHTLISSIRTCLQDKRYLVIVDDLWATSSWEIIKSALPDGNNYSRILTTTEIEDLSLYCCGHEPKYVFNLKPLGEDDSRTLFFNSVFGLQCKCPLELRDVSQAITSKCCGLPLAIVTIASILKHYPGTRERWDYVNKSLGCSLMKIPISARIKQILNVCYDNLPQYLKPCMLYTSIYEAGNIIQKDDLVNEWIAEGFIYAAEEQDSLEVSRGYFDELVHRKMIQPVDIDDNGHILSCVVHYIVLDLMTEKSLEENFVTSIHHTQASTVLADKVRRLSLHFGNAEDVTPPTNMRLSQVRTLAFFGIFECMPSIVEFRLLQVLILHFWGDNNDTICLDVTRISELFRLRYLKVASNVKIQLHVLMEDLQSLEILQIDARVTTVLSDTMYLPGSLHPRLPAETSLSNWICRMTSLRTLRCIDFNTDSMEKLRDLSSLTNLQDIRLNCCSTVFETSSKNKLLDHILWILEELGNLRCLTLLSKAFPHSSSLDSTSKKSSLPNYHVFRSVHAPTLLQRLEFSPCVFIFSCLPDFIGQLNNLCILKMGIKNITTGDIDVLGRLPSLAVLSLSVHTKLAERIVIRNDGFWVLKCFKFKSCVPWLKFEIGAMSNLRKLKLGFNASRGDQRSMMPIGMKYLSGIEEVFAKIGGAGSPEVFDTVTAELAFRDAVRMYDRCPRVIILCVNKIIGSLDGEEEEYGKPSEVLDEDSSKNVENSSKDRNKHKDTRGEARKGERNEATAAAVDMTGIVGSQPVMPEDGYQWEKYGQEFIKKIKKIRSYFRCRHNLCDAKKKVEWHPLDTGGNLRVVYEGVHQHGSPSSASGDQTGGGGGAAAIQY